MPRTFPSALCLGIRRESSTSPSKNLIPPPSLLFPLPLPLFSDPPPQTVPFPRRRLLAGHPAAPSWRWRPSRRAPSPALRRWLHRLAVHIRPFSSSSRSRARNRCSPGVASPMRCRTRPTRCTSSLPPSLPPSLPQSLPPSLPAHK